MRAVRVVVHGRVQGVGFRFHALRRATELGLNGWVRNLADGSVESEAVGDEDALRRFVEEMRAGPVGARVLEATEQWFESAAVPTGFHLER